MLVKECSRCEVTFMGGEDSRFCDDCEAARDPLRCEECRTRLLAPVASGLCGICDPAWVEHLAVAA